MAKDQATATAVAEPEIRKETLAEIRKIEKDIAEAEVRYEEHKDEAKAWKAHFDNRVAKLRDKCRSLSEPLPLFESNGQATLDGWRDITIEEALPGIPPALLKRLIDSELSTVGAMADYTAAEKRFSDLKGIGDAKAEAIEKALEQFWERRKEADDSMHTTDETEDEETDED